MIEVPIVGALCGAEEELAGPSTSPHLSHFQVGFEENKRTRQEEKAMGAEARSLEQQGPGLQESAMNR